MRDKYINYSDYKNEKDNYLNKLLFKYKIKRHNKNYLNKKISNFYKVGNYYLDNEQQKAIFSNEINTLVLAGAGSGKTLTIIGKINYLINELKIDEKEILCISFTNETVNNLKDRIKHNIDIFTFHKLSLEIIKDYNKNYSIVSEDYLSYIINEIFLSICNKIDEKILNSFNNEITSFINLFKVNNYDISIMDKLLKKNKDKLLLLIKKIYLIYNEELMSSNYIDFNDMIDIATRLIKEKGLRRYYKYIIIDEFQDISNTKYQLIKEIKKSCNSYIFAVGDDYQSIYKFAGSKLDLITSFKKYFDHPLIIRINNTYRNSNELIKVASKFITKNRYQIKKELVSSIHLDKSIKIIYYSKNMSIKFKKLISSFDSDLLILGRNSFDVNYLLDKDIRYEDGYIIYNNKKYKYMTVHKSKGLESKVVFLINLKDDYLGFPSKKTNKYTSLLLPKDKYLYEEERRLFYVALTRTKSYIYLFVDKDKPSSFVKELLFNSRKYIEILNI